MGKEWVRQWARQSAEEMEQMLEAALGSMLENPLGSELETVSASEKVECWVLLSADVMESMWGYQLEYEMELETAIPLGSESELVKDSTMVLQLESLWVLQLE
jgi:hypothetical protein